MNFYVVLCVISVLFFSCGTGSEVEGRHCAIEGRAVDCDGKPVGAAAVRIRPNGFCALYDSFSTFDTFTDAHGFFFFDTLPVDSYTIEINKNGKIGTLQQLSIGEYDSFPIVLPQVTLVPTGTIVGRINLPISDDSARPWVALYNVEYCKKVQFTQNFSFEGVPAGSYTLRFVASPESKLVMELRDVVVLGDSSIDLGTLILFAIDFFKGCASRACDSMAIQSVLDANSLSSVALSAIAMFDSLTGRVVALDLSGRGLTRITKEIGSLSRVAYLDLRNNRISVLPEHIGYLRELQILRLDSNGICELPAGINYLEKLRILSVAHNNLITLDQQSMGLSLDTLDLRYNRIEDLPSTVSHSPPARVVQLDNNEIIGLPMNIIFMNEIHFLSIKNNRLCTVPDAVGIWLRGFDGSWDESQRCE